MSRYFVPFYFRPSSQLDLPSASGGGQRRGTHQIRRVRGACSSGKERCCDDLGYENPQGRHKRFHLHARRYKHHDDQ